MADDWSIDITGETAVFAIRSAGMQVLEGDLGKDFGAIIEKLSTPGVNSYRYRLKGREAHDLRLLVNEDVILSRQMYLFESTYMLSEGELCTLTVNILDWKIRWQHVTVESVRIQQRTGPLYGRGAKNGSKHTIWSEWLFHRQKAGELLG